MRTLLTQMFCLVCNTQKLLLNGNKIGDAGMIKFSEALGVGGAMAHLRDLYLSGNSISDKTKDTMRTAMSNRSVSVHF